MARKLSDADVGRIRELALQGRSAAELAEEFGVTPRHIGRIRRGQQRQQIGGLDRDLASSSVVRAVERFVAGLEGVDDAGAVLAQTALALAHKLDDARDSDTAAAAGAAPALARQLVEVIASLRGDAPIEDGLTRLQRKREARLLALPGQIAARQQVAQREG